MTFPEQMARIALASIRRRKAWGLPYHEERERLLFWLRVRRNGPWANKGA